AGDVRVDGPQLFDEACLAGPIPEIEPGVDLEEQMPALAENFPPQCSGKVGEGDRSRPCATLETLPLLGEVLGEPRLIISEGDFDHTSLAPVEPSKKRCRCSRDRENLFRGPSRPTFPFREVHAALQGFES